MSAPPLTVPWLPPGQTIVLPGRGEVFVRVHRHSDPGRPWLLLLHGWTASADLQFFTAYEALAEQWSFVAIDHRGHGRGMRPTTPFRLEDAADDAAAALEQLGVGQVVTVGYSMGGPISMYVAQRHPHLVCGLVVQATALEWSATRWERARWRSVRLLGPIMRSWAYPRWVRYLLTRLLGVGHQLEPYVPWLEGEMRRGDHLGIVQAGRALSRHDARLWASALGRPAAAVVTTRDRLVPPRKQRELATVLGAEVIELDGDHTVCWETPDTYRAATVTAAASVLERVVQQQQQSQSSV